ncbi:MAG: TIGR03862 family flavoprotein, partial [Rubrivivax sp.]|nr:TIGR03862 family flavoprotein [Rubrivivax sp.]
QPAAVVLALGGGSWSRLGSDGAWAPWLAERGVELAPLLPSNCGFEVAWSEHLRQRHAGAALKGVAIEYLDAGGLTQRQPGEFIVTGYGVEGSLIYAASAALRSAGLGDGKASFKLDLLPHRSLEWVAREVAHPRGPRSLSTHLKTRLGLHGVKAALIHERVPKAELADPQRLAEHIKGLQIEVGAARPLDEAISSAGGVRFQALDPQLMLRALPGVFCAGEMLDWEAPTGGYLITACLATGRAAGQGAAQWLAAPKSV